MALATAVGKEMKAGGLLEDLEVSEEINACSIKVDVTVDGKTEEWLVMFKNETHNHPTEIEPDGGAATCLGGGIRDPLSAGPMFTRRCGSPAAATCGSRWRRPARANCRSGRSRPKRRRAIVPRNQIGVASGLVAEIYDEGFVAKRMEMGAVIGAAPRAHVVRERRSRATWCSWWAAGPAATVAAGHRFVAGAYRGVPLYLRGRGPKGRSPFGTEDPAAFPPAGGNPDD